jgi:DNA-binding transcriptional ArsR family regulator
MTTGHVADATLDRVYGAIADRTRREILATLAGGDATIGALANRFPISFNGVSKHVKVLERAGLVRRTVVGREHYVRLRARPLDAAARWLIEHRAFWNARLDALAELVETGHPRTRKGQ